MNVSHLEWFCRAFELRSFAKTAEGAFVSRQALGKAMQGLERELGTTLFVRSETGAEPTAAAEAIYPLACRIVENARTMRALCGESSPGARLQLRLALAYGVLQSLSPGLLIELEEECPDIEFIIEKGFYTDCFARLECGEADFALCPGPPPEMFSPTLLVRERSFFLASPSLLASVRSEGKRGGLVRVPFFTPRIEPPLDPRLEQAMEPWGIIPCVDSQYSDYDFIIQKVMAGQGITTAPQNVVDVLEGSDLTMIPLPEDVAPWEVYLLHRDEALTEPEQRVYTFFESRAVLLP